MRAARWQRCPDCEDYFCNVHEKHVADCDCPTLEELIDQGVDPYREGVEGEELEA